VPAFSLQEGILGLFFQLGVGARFLCDLPTCSSQGKPTTGFQPLFLFSPVNDFLFFWRVAFSFGGRWLVLFFWSIGPRNQFFFAASDCRFLSEYFAWCLSVGRRRTDFFRQNGRSSLLIAFARIPFFFLRTAGSFVLFCYHARGRSRCPFGFSRLRRPEKTPLAKWCFMFSPPQSFSFSLSSQYITQVLCFSNWGLPVLVHWSLGRVDLGVFCCFTRVLCCRRTSNI